MSKRRARRVTSSDSHCMVWSNPFGSNDTSLIGLKHWKTLSVEHHVFSRRAQTAHQATTRRVGAAAKQRHVVSDLHGRAAFILFPLLRHQLFHPCLKLLVGDAA